MQTSYSQYMDAGVAGLIYDMHDYDCSTFVAEAAIPAGAGVIAGTAAGKQVKVPTATSTKFEGVALKTAKEQDANGMTVLNQYDAVSVMKRGRVWVNVTGAVAYGDAVFLEFGTNKGKFSKTTSAENFAVTGARFITATSGAGLAVLELD